VQGDFGHVRGHSESYVTPRVSNPKHIAWSRNMWCFQRVGKGLKRIRPIFGCKGRCMEIKVIENLRRGRICEGDVAALKAMAEEVDIPYRILINLYLHDCAVHHQRLQMTWE